MNLNEIYFEFDNKTKTFIISYYFNKKICYFNQNINKILFKNKIEPKYSRFNQKVNNLPKNLTHLTFGMLFNQKVNNSPKYFWVFQKI
jgi:hypothetical protein